jgi:N-dimethylarginine dimethylaminohydrolase
MCKPNFFDVKYEINAWMDRQIRPESSRSWSQWQSLHHTLIRLGAWVEYVMPDERYPDIVFTANAGLIRGKKVVLARFRPEERRGEQPIYKAWFEENGFEVYEPMSGFFEGEGDALFAGDLLVAGHGFRSDRQVAEEVAQALDAKKVISVKLIDPRFYHLDTCFCPLNSKTAFFYPAAFDAESVKVLEDNLELIPVATADAVRFACNAVVLDHKVVLPDKCEGISKVLNQRGFETYPVALGEFLKGGGAAKCLSLRLQN